MAIRVSNGTAVQSWAGDRAPIDLQNCLTSGVAVSSPLVGMVRFAINCQLTELGCREDEIVTNYNPKDSSSLSIIII